jgi:hypothetical protein
MSEGSLMAVYVKAAYFPKSGSASGLVALQVLTEGLGRIR